MSPVDAKPLPRRAYVAVIAACMLAGLGIGAAWLLHKRERLAGTDSVEPANPIVNVPAGGRLCVRDLLVPGNADKVRFDLTTGTGKPVGVRLTLDTAAGGRVTSATTATSGYTDFKIPRSGRDSGGSACLHPSGLLAVWGYSGLPATTRPQSFIDGRPMQARTTVWFWDTRPRSLLSLLGTAARRASVFRAGFVGDWTYLVAALMLPLLWWAGLRTLVRGAR